jgi:alkylation response protein AidB-like acyl-CoA dehydrogenase
MTSVLTAERQVLVETIRDFARRECGTREERRALTDDGRDMHNVELYKKLAKLGWVGMDIDEKYGGAGAGVVEECLVLEETTRARLPIRFMSVSLISAGIYARYGTEQQKQEVLRSISAGNLVAIAISEPEAGSDVANIGCRAASVKGGFVVNGQKTWTSGAHKSERICLVCRTDPTPQRREGLTMLSVPTDTQGVAISPIDTMGDHEVNDLYFTDCFVSEGNVVGEVGNAWQQLMSGLNKERLIAAAFSLGLAQRAFDDVLDYVKQRRQFGRAIGSFQSIRHRLAELATEIECSRLLLYAVAQAVDANPESLRPRQASMAKFKATEVAKRISLEGMQMMGGYGYTREYDMVEDVIQSLPMTIYAGATEVQLDIIAKTFGLAG